MRAARDGVSTQLCAELCVARVSVRTRATRTQHGQHPVGCRRSAADAAAEALLSVPRLAVAAAAVIVALTPLSSCTNIAGVSLQRKRNNSA